MQILVRLLLLTVFTPSETAPSQGTAAAHSRGGSQSPKKRKRGSGEDAERPTSREAIEEDSEMLMDKLAMWQLMGSLDQTETGAPTKTTAIPAKGKGKEADERDWMQIFCEDVVEVLYVLFLSPFSPIVSSFSLSLFLSVNPTFHEALVS